MTATQPKDIKSFDVSFNVLELLNRERTTFGLRNTSSNTSSSLSSTGGEKDYDRYRQHCSNKIHRLRQVTGKGCGDVKKGFKGVKKVEVGDVKDVKPLQLLLFQSERSYAHSKSLLVQLTRSKSSSAKSTDPTNDIGPRALKKEQLSKLRRAVGYAEELDELVKAIGEGSGTAAVTVSTQTRLEILTHLLHLRSQLTFHRSQYEQSLPLSCLRSHILSILSSPSNCSSSYAQALYSEEMDSSEPILRFAAYKLGRKETHDVSAIVAEFAGEGAWEEIYEGFGALLNAYEKEVDARGSNAGEAGDGKSNGRNGTLEPITWATESIQIRNASIVNAMVRAQSTIAALDASNQAQSKTSNGSMKKVGNAGANVKVMNRWDAVLAALGEAEVVARRAAEEDQNNASARRTTGPTTSSPTFVHQYISHLLLSYRIRRDLLLTSTLGDPLRRTTASTLVLKPSTATKPKSQPITTNTSKSRHPQGKQPLTRAKKAEALKTLNALVKLYDSVLQGLGQIRELGIVEEREGVRRGAEGMEAYFKAVRCVKLAQMYLLLPTAEYSSSVHLATQATTYASDARTALGLNDNDENEDPIQLLELFHPISAQDDLEPLDRQASDLEAVTKRALYAEVKGRPLFYDTAFNYIDLPLEELEIAAGRTPASSAEDAAPSTTTAATTAKSLVSTLANVVSDPVHAIENVVGTAKKTVTPESRGRESTPGPGGEGDAQQDAGEAKPKGWFGGLWGGRK